MIASAAPLDVAAIARSFKGGGRKIEQAVAKALSTLTLYGRATALPNGKYAARRAA